MKTKSLDIYFRDWMGEAFGFGYGTGELYIIPLLRKFFEALKDGRSYDHRELEKDLGVEQTWLLINALCTESIIEYGTSPRCGWLTGNGSRLREFVLSKTNDELYEMTGIADEDEPGCDRQYCYCGPNGYVEGRRCPNPFFFEPWQLAKQDAPPEKDAAGNQ